MSKIKVQSPSSGTAVFTLTTASGTSTDRTITLPDSSVTLGAATPSITDNGNATAITIDSSERVGIGQTSPAALLHIKGGAPAFNIESSTNSTSRTWGLKTETVAGGDLDFQYGTSLAAIPSVSSLRLTNDGRGLSQFTAKAWCNFDGTGSASSWERDSHNVSSYTDVGTGSYTVNFSNNMANTNYSIGLSVSTDTAPDQVGCQVTDWHPHTNGYSYRTSSAFKIGVTKSNFTSFDVSSVNAQVFGD